MNKAKQAYSKENFESAFTHLERAHILGQRYFLSHWATHYWMLKIGLRRFELGEILGQFLRLLAVVPGYIFGWVPKGNTGGSNVSPLLPMPIPSDLQELLEDYSVGRDVLKRVLIGLILGGLAYTFY